MAFRPGGSGGFGKCRALLWLILAGAAGAFAGPPFQTDDPEPVPFRHYELYLFSLLDSTGLATSIQGPAVEFNWGAAPNVQLHVLVPPTSNLPAGGAYAFGLGDVETGIKYRFIQETRHRPQVGIFPFFELPAGNARLGLGNGQLWMRLPVWIQKSEGPWTTYGGGGMLVNQAPGMRSYPFGGWLVQRDLNRRIALGTEVFAHGAAGPQSPSPRGATMIDAGGYYNFSKGFSLLFAAGHSVAGQSETYAYFSFYWTWGNAAAKPRPQTGAGAAPYFPVLTGLIRM